VIPASSASDIEFTKIAYKATVPPSDPEMETFLVKLFQIVRQHANQDNDNLCKDMIAEAFRYSEKEQSNHHSSRIQDYL
jgi:hypothetical protein